MTRPLSAFCAGICTVGALPAVPVTLTDSLVLPVAGEGEDEHPASAAVTASGARSAAVRRRMNFL